MTYIHIFVKIYVQIQKASDERLITFIEKSPNKFDPQSHGPFSFILLVPTNMTYKPIPNVSMAVPTRNMSAKMINIYIV
jgi:hypothetical protein